MVEGTRSMPLLAQSTAPRLALKRVHPHIMRHSAAVHLLQAGVDLVSTSHWLGHASVETTNRCVAVDLNSAAASLSPPTLQEVMEKGLGAYLAPSGG